MSQIGVLILINIVFGFASGGRSTTRRISAASRPGCGWGARPTDQRPDAVIALAAAERGGRVGAGQTTAPGYIVVLGLGVVGIVVAAGIAVGTNERLGIGRGSGTGPSLRSAMSGRGRASSGAATAASSER